MQQKRKHEHSSVGKTDKEIMVYSHKETLWHIREMNEIQLHM